MNSLVFQYIPIIMDPGSQPSSSTTNKIERRLIEKNRRNHMKMLYSKLNSLLPNYNPKEALPLPDQVDEAINYIKNLEEKVKTAKEKKDGLLERMGRKRTRGGGRDGSGCSNTKPPQLEVHETGSCLEIVMTCGLENQFIFYEIIRILNEENIDVKSANSSLLGDSMIHVLHAEIPPLLIQFGATKVSERLKRFVNGSASDIELLQPEFWDFEIDTDIWSF
nr:transcription factor bHLH162-like [Arachis hypogaea]